MSRSMERRLEVMIGAKYDKEITNLNQRLDRVVVALRYVMSDMRNMDEYFSERLSYIKAEKALAELSQREEK